jgi:hypothetical protein
MNIQNNNNNYSLYSIENYKDDLDTDNEEIINKYSILILDYFKFIIENLKMKNNNYIIFIILRGLDTITHVFLNLLLYTKNINLTYYHCQKSFYFFVEFVGQITEEEKMFLQLTSRDATIYVYKKTIYDLKNKSNKDLLSSEILKKNFKVINKYVDLYKLLLQKIIMHINYSNINSVKIQEISNSLGLIYNKLNYELVDKENFYLFEMLITQFYEKIEDSLIFIEIIKNVLKKYLKKTKINLINFENNLNIEQFYDKYL